MQVIQPEVFIGKKDWGTALKEIEMIGRVCYKSEERCTGDSADSFIRGLIKRGHTSILEHASISIKFTADRGVSHELVRHRIASPSQESTRYVRYDSTGATFISPFFFPEGSNQHYKWRQACEDSSDAYRELMQMGALAQEARTVLNNSTKTELWITANMREWRAITSLRADKAAHPQMRQIMIPALIVLKRVLPPLFDDIALDRDFLTDNYARVTIGNIVPIEGAESI